MSEELVGALMDAIRRSDVRQGFVGHAIFIVSHKDLTEEVAILCREDPTQDATVLLRGAGIASRRFRKAHRDTSMALKLITATYAGFRPF